MCRIGGPGALAQTTWSTVHSNNPSLPYVTQNSSLPSTKIPKYLSYVLAHVTFRCNPLSQLYIFCNTGYLSSGIPLVLGPSNSCFYRLCSRCNFHTLSSSDFPGSCSPFLPPLNILQFLNFLPRLLSGHQCRAPGI